MRATRLAQVISVLGSEQDLETTVERVAIEVGELFFADMALLILDSDAGMTVAGHWGIAAADVPVQPFTLPDVDAATAHGRCASAQCRSCRCPRGLRPTRPATSPGRGCWSAIARSGCCCWPAR